MSRTALGHLGEVIADGSSLVGGIGRVSEKLYAEPEFPHAGTIFRACAVQNIGVYAMYLPIYAALPPFRPFLKNSPKFFP